LLRPASRGRARRVSRVCRKTGKYRRSQPCRFKRAKAEIPLADGDLTPSEAVDVAKVIDVYVGALATKAFEERLAKLESAANR